MNKNNKFTLAVVTHTKREEMAASLCNEVLPEFVCVDDNNLGVGLNHLRALKLAYGHAIEHHRGWVAILEDDSIPVENFGEELSECLIHAPSPVVSLYLGTGYPAHFQDRFKQAVTENVPWILHRHLRHAVGYCISTNVMLSMRNVIDPLLKTNWAPDDAISQYMKQSGLMVSYTNPSIIDHRDTPSVIASRTHMGMPVFGRNKPRKAHKFGTPPEWNDSYTTVEVIKRDRKK